MKESHKEYFDKTTWILVKETESSYELQLPVKFPSETKNYTFWMSKKGMDDLIDNWDKIEERHRKEEYERWFGRYEKRK
jgi:hypothetical protein